MTSLHGFGTTYLFDTNHRSPPFVHVRRKRFTFNELVMYVIIIDAIDCWWLSLLIAQSKYILFNVIVKE